MERMDRLNAFQNLLEQKEYLTLRAAMTRENEVDIAEFIEGLSKENAADCAHNIFLTDLFI